MSVPLPINSDTVKPFSLHGLVSKKGSEFCCFRMIHTLHDCSFQVHIFNARFKNKHTSAICDMLPEWMKL